MRFVVMLTLLLAILAGPVVASPTFSPGVLNLGPCLVCNPSLLRHTGSGVHLFCGWCPDLCCPGHPFCPGHFQAINEQFHCFAGGASGCLSHADNLCLTCPAKVKVVALVFGCYRATGSQACAFAQLGLRQAFLVCPCQTYHVVASVCRPCLSTNFIACTLPGGACCFYHSSGCTYFAAGAGLKVTFGGAFCSRTFFMHQTDSRTGGTTCCKICSTNPLCFCVTIPSDAACLTTLFPCAPYFFCPAHGCHLATYLTICETAGAFGIQGEGSASAEIDPTLSLRLVVPASSGAPEIDAPSVVTPALAILALFAILADRRRR